MGGLIVIGAGGHGRSVAEAVLLSGSHPLLGFVDDGPNAPATVWDFPVLGGTGDLAHWRQQADFAVVAIGNNTARERLCDALRAAGFQLATVIHPRAVVSPRAVVGEGVTVMAGAIVGTEANLGSGVIVNSGAVVDHHACVHDYGHLGVNACMAGGSVLGRGAWMQAGSALGYGVKVPAGEVLPPGAALST